MEAIKQPKEKIFTRYEVFVIAILSILQFTIILDFMVMAPLGEQLMKEMHMLPSQFSWVVSAYAFSAGTSGLLTAGFADKFDRKRLLIFFYVGFILGTLMCGLAPNYYSLLLARIITGIFGGVIGGISFAIIGDLFAMKVRGRVMGFVQMGFSLSQIAGIPISLFLANKFDWHAPFIMIVIFGTIVGIVIASRLKPVTGHLETKHDRNPFMHLAKTITQKQYIQAFITTSILSIGGFLLMPFSSDFLVNNVGILREKLPLIFMCVGVFTVFTGPVVGKLSDKLGKYKLFCIGSAVAAVMVIIYTNLSNTPFALVVVINVLLFVGIFSRIIPSSALISSVPPIQDRGAFMSINSSIQQIAGGIASVVAGLIIVKQGGGRIEHYDILGYISVALIFVCVLLMSNINKMVAKRDKEATKPQMNIVPAEV